MSESLIQSEILNALSRGRLRLWRQNAGKVFVTTYRPGLRGSWIDLAPAGAADLTGIYDDGRRIEIEVKTPTGKQSHDQIAWERMIRSRGGVYILGRSVDDVRRQLVESGVAL